MVKLFLIAALLVGCGKGFNSQDTELDSGLRFQPLPADFVYFPIASATIKVSSLGDLAALAKKQNLKLADLIIQKANAQVAQGSATVNVTYTNPGVTQFTINTSSFGNAITVSGNDLNLGTISLNSLDDNSLRVCTGVGSPGNRCNRLFIRVFTLGTATGVTATSGFINVDGQYGIDVFAGNVLTAIGFNASPTASLVTNAATVYTYTIPNGTNRVRLSNLVNTPFPIKADLSNAGSGLYEMNLVVQYALGYVP